MLHVDRASLATLQQSHHHDERSNLDLEDLWSAFRQRWPLMLLVMALSIGGGVAIILTTRPTYVASAKLLIDNHNPDGLVEGSTMPPVDSSEVDSQVEVLNSAVVATGVIHDLGLMSDPDFVPSPDRAGTDAFRQALLRFGQALSVRRVGQSHAIEVTFQSHSAVQAAVIANQVVEYYLAGRWREGGRSAASRRFTANVRQSAEPVENAQLVTHAEIPLGKSTPRSTLIIALSASMGLLASGALALLLGRRDTRIRSYDQITRALGTSAYEAIPKLLGRDIRRSRALSAAVRSPASNYSDAIHNLKTMVDDKYLNNGAVSIGVIALQSFNGATTLVSNLAAIYAAGGARVLLIDANFHNPALSRALVPNAAHGLPDFVDGKVEEDAYYVTQHGFWFIPLVSARQSLHGAHLLRSPKIARFLDAAKANFDVILIDLPGFNTMADSRPVAAICDTCLLVCEWKLTRTEKLLNAIASIGKAGLAMPLGVVINKVPRS